MLRYSELAPIRPEPEQVSALLAAIAEPVQPGRRIDVLADKPDIRVLEAAVTGQADAIVTGDAELLELQTFEDIPILTARELLDMISTSQPLTVTGRDRMLSVPRDSHPCTAAAVGTT